MVKVKVAEASDMVLDYMVAVALGGTEPWFDTVNTYWIKIDGKDRALSTKWSDQQNFAPTTLWAHGGPIIEREGIGFFCNRTMKMGVRFKPNAGADWRAFAFNKHYVHHFGPTALIAAMRCYAISELGPEVEVPDELLEE